MSEMLPMAMPWYENESDFDAVCAMLPASERQDPIGYRAFRAKIEAYEKQFQRGGGLTSRIPVNAAAIKTWCEANDRQVCRESINLFIIAELAIRLRDGPRNN
jgi:hypothetical protein